MKMETLLVGYIGFRVQVFGFRVQGFRVVF